MLIAPGLDLRSGCAVGELIAEAAGLDMAKWWSASSESYFGHVRKDVIIDAIKEVNPALDRAKLDKLSKKDVLARAKRVFKGATWLPAPLRVSAGSTLPAATDAIAAE